MIDRSKKIGRARERCEGIIYCWVLWWNLQFGNLLKFIRRSYDFWPPAVENTCPWERTAQNSKIIVTARRRNSAVQKIDGGVTPPSLSRQRNSAVNFLHGALPRTSLPCFSFFAVRSPCFPANKPTYNPRQKNVGLGANIGYSSNNNFFTKQIHKNTYPA